MSEQKDELFKPEIPWAPLLRALDGQALPGRSRGLRMDAEPLSIWSERELLTVAKNQIERLFDRVTAERFIPVTRLSPPGAVSYAIERVESRGTPKFVSESGGDIPRVSVGKTRELNNIGMFAQGYDISIQDMWSSQLTGISLSDRLGDAVSESMAAFMAETLYFGNQAADIPGFFTNPSVPDLVLTNGDWANPSTTVANVIADIGAMFRVVRETTDDRFTPNTLLLTYALEEAIRSKLSGATDRTPVDLIRSNYPEIEAIESLVEMNSLVRGQTTTNGLLLYRRDPQVLQGNVPLAIQPMAPQVKGLMTSFDFVSIVGGTYWYYPQAAVFALNA